MKNYYKKSIHSTILFLLIGVNYLFAQTHLSTPNDLRGIESNVNGSYILDNNIDMTSESWNQFDFKGTLDGNGYSIKNLNINHSGDRGGLFNNITDATVKNLGLENLTVNTPNAWTGGIAGNSSNAIITKCFVTGTISSNGFAGGLVGHAFNSTITKCYSKANVTGRDHVGGLVGHMNTGTINNCYVEAVIISTAWQVGGLVGWATSPTCLITNSFVKGTVKSQYGFTGAILGIADGGDGAVIVSNCIAMQDKIESTNPDIVKTYRVVANENGLTAVMTNNYGFDFMTITDPYKTDLNLLGKDGDDISSAQFKDAALYATNLPTWDFTNVWVMESTGPQLRWASGSLNTVTNIKQNNFSVYPNPAKDLMFIASDESLISDINITDLNGRIVMKNTFNKVSQAQIDIAPLATGLYIMNVKSDSGSFTKKIIKK
ncbi:MAG: T9SS type A sorting domain-containing protein [Flavobacterium sp.]|nr:T9SS type A sorting domain-containing protein [Flavobacterium sp.]